MRLTHLNGLRAVEATLRLGSFTEAADELGVTPAAVGQRVRALELYLGKDLFLRSASGIEPTEQAQSIARQLTRGFSMVADALEALSATKADSLLRVTLPESFSENWLSPILSDFYLRHPEITLHLDASNRDVDLRSDQFDLAIRYGPPGGTDFQERVLFGDCLVPVCSPGFAKRYGITEDLRSLEGIPLVHVTNRTKDPGWVGFEAWGEAFGFDEEHLTHGIRFSKTGSGLQAAIAGQGLVLCGVVEAFQALRAGLLVLPFGPRLKSVTRYKYRLLWLGSGRKSPALEDFVAWAEAKACEYEADLKQVIQ